MAHKHDAPLAQRQSSGFFGMIISRMGVFAINLVGDTHEGVASKLSDISPLQTHDIVTAGLPVILVRDLMATYNIVAREAVLVTIGVSERTLQRGKNTERTLDANASDRLLRLAAVTEQAIDVFGSQDAAESWLISPAIGLDGRKPLDLLQSSEGGEMVKSFLTRIDYGVYS